MKENQALTKAAEEITRGLAQAEKLRAVCPNKRSIGHVVRVTAIVALSDALDDDGRGAMAKIYIARRIQGMSGDYRSCLSALTGVTGRAVSDAAIVKLDLEREYERWREHMIREGKSASMSVAVDIISEGKTFAEAGRALSMPVSDKTAKAMAIDACMEFVAANDKKRYHNTVIC